MDVTAAQAAAAERGSGSGDDCLVGLVLGVDLLLLPGIHCLDAE